jgi:hypothetical protein
LAFASKKKKKRRTKKREPRTKRIKSCFSHLASIFQIPTAKNRGRFTLPLLLDPPSARRSPVGRIPLGCLGLAGASAGPSLVSRFQSQSKGFALPY